MTGVPLPCYDSRNHSSCFRNLESNLGPNGYHIALDIYGYETLKGMFLKNLKPTNGALVKKLSPIMGTYIAHKMNIQPWAFSIKNFLLSHMLCAFLTSIHKQALLHALALI